MLLNLRRDKCQRNHPLLYLDLKKPLTHQLFRDTLTLSTWRSQTLPGTTGHPIGRLRPASEPDGQSMQKHTLSVDTRRNALKKQLRRGRLNQRLDNYESCESQPS